MAGDETSTQSFGFGGISDEDLLLEAAACAPNGTNRFQQLGAVPPAQLQLHVSLVNLGTDNYYENLPLIFLVNDPFFSAPAG
jgi:hypothetical protein